MSDRKSEPVFSGVMRYFPKTLRAVARLSKAGNDKHNPGEPLRWAREKSADDADACARHLLDHAQDPTGTDPDSGELHAVSVAWRALAVCEKALEEAERQAAQPHSDQSGWCREAGCPSEFCGACLRARK